MIDRSTYGRVIQKRNNRDQALIASFFYSKYLYAIGELNINDTDGVRIRLSKLKKILVMSSI